MASLHDKVWEFPAEIITAITELLQPALWPEELITAGKLKRGSALHRALVAAERACLRDAAAVVSLTYAAVDYLDRACPHEMHGQRVAVIPTCADLDRFQPAAQPTKSVIYGCLGTILSGWFRADWLASFLSVAASRAPDARFELTTRDNPDQIRSAIGGGHELQRRIDIFPSPSDDVQKVLQGQIASVFFYAGGETSELGRSPTRLAEILGCGLPVISNEGVGDVARIVRENKVGVLAAGPLPEQMEPAYDELQELLRDPDLARRCRNTAERIYSLKVGTKAFAQLYDDILQDTMVTNIRKGH